MGCNSSRLPLYDGKYLQKSELSLNAQRQPAHCSPLLILAAVASKTHMVGALLSPLFLPSWAPLLKKTEEVVPYNSFMGDE